MSLHFSSNKEYLIVPLSTVENVKYGSPQGLNQIDPGGIHW